MHHLDHGEVECHPIPHAIDRALGPDETRDRRREHPEERDADAEHQEEHGTTPTD